MQILQKPLYRSDVTDSRFIVLMGKSRHANTVHHDRYAVARSRGSWGGRSARRKRQQALAFCFTVQVLPRYSLLQLLSNL